jgi:outer membrane protein assembly factor BamB
MKQIWTCLAPALLAAMAASAADLPYGHADFVPTIERPIGWRGDYTGVYPGATPVLSWDTEKGTNVRWKLRMPGTSNAEPIIVGDPSAPSTNSAQAGSGHGLVITTAEPHYLIAVELKTGKIRWQTVVNPMEYIAGTTPELQAKYLQALPIFTRIEEIRVKHHISSNRAIPDSALGDLKEGWRLLSKQLADLDTIVLDGMPTNLPPIPSAAEIDAITGAFSDSKHPFNRPYLERVKWFPKKYGFALIDVWPAWGGWTLPTPACDGKKVYVMFGQGQLGAYDVATGKKVWGIYTGPLRKLNSSNMRFTAPMLVRDRLIAHFADKINAISTADGSILWQTPYMVGSYNMGGPHLLKPDGKTELLATAEGTIVRFSDGKELGKLGVGNRAAEHGGLYCLGDRKDRVFMMPGGNDPAPMHAFRIALTGETVQVQQIWQDTQDCSAGSPIFLDDLIYENKHDKALQIRDANTGKLIVTSLTARPSSPSPAIAGKHLFSANHRGDVFVSTIGRDAKHLGMMLTVDECDHPDCPKSPDGSKRNCKYAQCEAGPTFLGDAVVLRTHNYLWCFSATK